MTTTTTTAKTAPARGESTGPRLARGRGWRAGPAVFSALLELDWLLELLDWLLAWLELLGALAPPPELPGAPELRGWAGGTAVAVTAQSSHGVTAAPGSRAPRQQRQQFGGPVQAVPAMTV